ncbi:MAG: hypothetical protein K6G85_04715 [Eubacterium sp.]|nr:hypothetical protein [Eubacterium sp.]
MRKNLMKKVTAVALSMTMVIGSVGVVSAAHAANGANVISGAKWSTFSVRDDAHGGAKTEWESALEAEIQSKKDQVEKDYKAGKISEDEYNEGIALADSYQSYTEGWAASNPKIANTFSFYVKNTGWDGQYDKGGKLVGDNPYGLHFELTGIPVEKGRSYTVSFNIKSTLKGKKPVRDSEGNEVKDPETGDTVTEPNTVKHASFKVYDPVSQGGPKVEFDTITGADLDGSLVLDSTETEGKKITCKVTVPKNYGATTMGIMFTLGAYIHSLPDELAMSGQVDISDLKVIAGAQYKVTFTGNKKSYTTYVNKGGRASITAGNAMKFGKKKYTIDYYTLNGKKYNMASAVTKDITLVAHYTKTKKASKPTIKSAKSPSKKKVKVVLKKKAKNAVGYQIRYSTKKNMKKAKKKTTKKTSYTLKGIKSGSIVYIQVRGYNLDSLGNEVYGKWSKKKVALVR